MSRVFLLLASMLVTVGVFSGIACPHAARAQDSGVFQYQDRQGRKVYTNLEGMASHGKALKNVPLPPLSSIDFERAPAAELRALDDHVHEAHGALQAGDRCEAIRKNSRSPDRSRLWADHGRKIATAGGLLVFAALLGLLGVGRRLGALFPLAPLAGCAFLGYATFRDIQGAREALTSGLRACSEQLPDGEAGGRTAVRERLSKALDLQNVINASFQRQAAEIERTTREY